MSDRIDSLSEGQKACLRLVAEGVTQSKEIAQKLNLSHLTVDQYLSKAAKSLGATNRVEAAKRFTLMEKNSEFRPQFRSEALVRTAQPRHYFAQEASDARSNGVLASLLKLPPIGGEYADGDWQTKTYAILHIAIIAVIVLFGIALLIAGVSHTFG